MRFLRFERYGDMVSKISYCCFFLLGLNVALAQQDSLTQTIPNTDSLNIQIDSLIAPEKKRKNKEYPNPKRAAFLSLALPGAGHIYNKKYWKAPISIAAIGTSVFFIERNTKLYKTMQYAYCNALVREGRRSEDLSCGDEPRFLDNNSNGTTAIFGLASPNWRNVLLSQETRNSDAIKNLRDDFDKYRQLSWISLLGVHFLNSAWAFVDAHFLDFNIDEDLSLRLQPSIQTTSFAPASGVGLVLTFGD